jgi:hypothetical protein
MDEPERVIEGGQDMARVFVRAFDNWDKKFSVNFDSVWTFLGYSSKGNALRRLKQKFAAGVDFLTESYPARHPSGGGAPVKQYMLTPAAFERFALSTESERGTLVRDFFVALKEQYFHTLENIHQHTPAALINESNLFLEGEHTKLAQSIEWAPKGSERAVQCYVHECEGGVMEIPCRHGQVDIVTATEVIEVKPLTMWKHALGQVLAYSACFPKHRARIHLYMDDEEQSTDLSDIIEICCRVGVRVTFHQHSVCSVHVL